MHAVLLHTGYYSSSPVLPPNSTLELRATIRILESQNSKYMDKYAKSVLCCPFLSGKHVCCYCISVSFFDLEQYFVGLVVIVYISTLRNGLRSRAWGGGSGCSYTVERCRIMKVRLAIKRLQMSS